MNDRSEFIQSAHLYQHASNLVMSTFPLQEQIIACNHEIATLIASGHNKVDLARVRNLEDEIFGCKIEIQAKRLKAKRLLNQALEMRPSRDKALV
jgi:hypothetical protein